MNSRDQRKRSTPRRKKRRPHSPPPLSLPGDGVFRPPQELWEVLEEVRAAVEKLRVTIAQCQEQRRQAADWLGKPDPE